MIDLADGEKAGLGKAPSARRGLDVRGDGYV
jgi:hypothetical protein